MENTDNTNQFGSVETKSFFVTKPKLHKGIVIFLISLFSLGAYANSLRGDFIWDDQNLIVNNTQIKSWDNLAQNLSVGFFQRSRYVKPISNYYRPLITLSYMIDYSIWGENPLGYHITNLLWHIANGIIIYFFVLVLFQNSKLALITSLLFATHPIHTESVSWISGRTDVICSFFFFASLYSYCLADLHASKKKLLSISVSSLCFLLGIYSKEMVLTLPLILIVMDYFKFSGKNLRKRIKYWLPYWIILLVYLFLRLVVLTLGVKENLYLATIGKQYVLLTFGRALIYYFKKIIYPLHLSPYVIIEVVTQWIPIDVIFAIVLFLVSIVFVLFKRKIQSKICFAILFFWISVIPISNIVSIGGAPGMKFSVAERFMYIPLFAFCLLIAILLGKLEFVRFKRLALGTITVAVILLFYTGATINANRLWQDEVRFYLCQLEKFPKVAFLNHNLGVAYCRRQDYDQAIYYLNKAIQLKPNAKSYSRLALCYDAKGDLQKAIAEAKNALKHNPNHLDAIYNLGVFYWETGKPVLAIDEFTKAIKIDPHYEPVINAFKFIQEQIKEREQVHKPNAGKSVIQNIK